MRAVTDQRHWRDMFAKLGIVWQGNKFSDNPELIAESKRKIQKEKRMKEKISDTGL